MQGSDSIFTRTRRRMELFESQIPNLPLYNSNRAVRYEMEDTSTAHEMADTSIREADSEVDSASDEDAVSSNVGTAP